jgi:hypothetical protein
MQQSTKALVLYLAIKWPDKWPSSTSWTVILLYLIDKEFGNCTGLSWDSSEFYPRNQSLEKYMARISDEIGCFCNLKTQLNRGESEKAMNQILIEITPEQKKAADFLLLELENCKTIIDTLNLKNRAQTYLQGKK